MLKSDNYLNTIEKIDSISKFDMHKDAIVKIITFGENYIPDFRKYNKDSLFYMFLYSYHILFKIKLYQIIYLNNCENFAIILPQMIFFIFLISIYHQNYLLILGLRPY